MPFITDLFRSFSGTSAAAASTASRAPATPATSPLAPAFDRAQLTGGAKRRADEALRESQWLGENFKACLMEVGFVNVDADATFYGYGTHKPMTASLKAPADGRLDLVVCLNVSGHDLKDRADKQQALQSRANSNRYIIEVTRPDGKKERMSGIEAKGALATPVDVSIKGMTAGKWIIEAWPEGSAAVGGYVEGRRLELTVA